MRKLVCVLPRLCSLGIFYSLSNILAFVSVPVYLHLLPPPLAFFPYYTH